MESHAACLYWHIPLCPGLQGLFVRPSRHLPTQRAQSACRDATRFPPCALLAWHLSQIVHLAGVAVGRHKAYLDCRWLVAFAQLPTATHSWCCTYNIQTLFLAVMDVRIPCIRLQCCLSFNVFSWLGDMHCQCQQRQCAGGFVVGSAYIRLRFNIQDAGGVLTYVDLQVTQLAREQSHTLLKAAVATTAKCSTRLAGYPHAL